MRVVILDKNGPADMLRVTETPMAEPGEGQVQIRVAYAAVHPLDIHARSGAMKWGVPAFPFTLGYNYCGRVSKIGAGADAALMGKRVSVSGKYGGYADFAVVNATDINELAPNLSWQMGGFWAGSTLTAWHMLHTLARIRPDDWIVVHSAAGPVGAMLVQIARDAGCRIIGLVGGAAKLEWAKRLKADHLIDYVADKDWPKAVMTITENRGVDFIMDGNLGPDTLKEFGCLAPLGQVIAIGAMAGQSPEVNISKLIAGSQGVRGFVVNHGMAKTKGAERKTLLENITSGRWQFPISGPVKLGEIAAAHRMFERRQTTGRFLIEVGGEV